MSTVTTKEQLLFVTDYGTPSTPNTVHIVTTVKKNEKPFCCSDCLLILRILLLTIFIISSCGCGVMWFTQIYNNSFIESLVLENGTQAFEWWANPPLNPLLNVYIFNYTNIDDYMANKTDKIELQQLGPYVYKEKVVKGDLHFYENDTISFREIRSNKYMSKLTKGKQSDRVIVPNIPLITGVRMFRERGWLYRYGFERTVQGSNSTLFKKLRAHEFIWGYQDKLVDTSKSMASTSLPFDNFGVLVNRNGSSRDRFLIHTGRGDITKLTKVLNFNGETVMGYWSDNECNEVKGTDGSQFPPHLLNRKDKLLIFIKDLCRSFPLEYVEEVNIFDNVPAWRYVPEENIFGHPDVNPENYCYCHKESESCPPSGVFNATVCNYNAPIFISFPHFYGGDPVLFKKFNGLNPERSKHLTFADIHPRLGFPVGGASRFQVNIQISKSSMVPELSRFDEGDILPVLWFELVPGDIPEELRNLIYHSSFSINAVQVILEYGTLILMVASFAIFVMTYYCCEKPKDKNEIEKEEKGNHHNVKFFNNGIEGKTENLHL